MINLPPELPPSVDKAVENLTDKPTKVIGKGVSSIFSLVFNPINHLNDKQLLKYAHALEVYKQELDEKIAAIPEENLIEEPKLQIVAQALEDSKYCIEEPILREMFANLIASASDGTKADIVHPSFSAILKQMSPEDGLVAQKISCRHFFPVGRLKHQKPNLDEGYLFLTDNILIPDPSNISEVIPPDSLSNLLALGLIEIDYNQHLVAENAYEPFERFADAGGYKAHVELTDGKMALAKGICQLTPYGRNFAKACGLYPVR